MAINNASQFIATGWLMNPPRQVHSSAGSTTGDAAAAAAAQSANTSTSLVSIVWTAGNDVYKHVRKKVQNGSLVDVFNHRFVELGLHRVCYNMSNALSWSSKCASIWVLEDVHRLEVLGFRGGMLTKEGKYAVAKTSALLVDVVVNAGSFADVHFSFGDGSEDMKIQNEHNKTKKNCSCLSLFKKKHSFQKNGLFSLNITARNRLGKQELIFNDSFIVDGKITRGEIDTKFALAGMRKKVSVKPFGSFKHLAYKWKLGNRNTVKTSME